jgi:hypothetical protein
MRHTLKAFFAHQSDARHLLDELLASGHPHTNVTLSSELPAGQVDRLVLDGEDAKAGGSVKRFAARLLGSGQHKRGSAYSDEFARGHHVVTVAAGSEPDAARTIAIIERFHPVGIEDHDEEWDRNSVGAGTPGAGVDAAKMGRVYAPGTEPGALQDRAHEDSRYFGTQSADSPPTGNTFAETMGADSQWAHTDDGRLHVPRPAPFANSDNAVHDDYMAAYRYGKEMRTSDRYRNRSWDEAELGLSSGWETRAPDTPAWAESKPAIRRGWDEVTPEIDDDDYYRTHWTTRYAGSAGEDTYDNYKPAYIYGSEARRSEKYRSQDWHEVEPELQADWKARHAGQLSPWENFKDAVNHGWNRIGPDMDNANHDAVDALGDDDLSATYRHGSDAAHDIDHGGHHWNEADSNPKSDWDRRYPGTPPTWDKVKAAVRHGWDRVTH